MDFKILTFMLTSSYWYLWLLSTNISFLVPTKFLYRYAPPSFVLRQLNVLNKKLFLDYHLKNGSLYKLTRAIQ